MRLAHFNLALLAEQRGDVRLAEREYVEELKLHPDSFKAAFNLSRLYEQVGDREGQIGALKQSIESNPRFAEGHFFLAKAYLDPGSTSTKPSRWLRRDWSSRRNRSTRRSGTTCSPTSTTGRGAAAEAAQEVARGRALEARVETKSSRRGAERQPGSHSEKAPGGVRPGLPCVGTLQRSERSSGRRTSPDARPARRSAPGRAPSRPRSSCSDTRACRVVTVAVLNRLTMSA